VQLALVIESGAIFLDAVATNIGLGGAFVEVRPPLSYGTHITLIVELPELPRPAHLAGVVRWNDANGCGVQFLQLGARETYALSMVVALADKREHPPAGRAM
jgi:Tfp pilus assembly protein PilZ